jgi:serine/threonine protein kinase
MIKCVSCGSNQPDDAVACKVCGATLATGAIVLPETITRPPAISSGAPSLSRISVISEVEEGRFIPGTLIGGRYRIIQLLGRGGMGEVYRATDLALAQSVALKFLTGETAVNERLLERFHSEVRIARQVSHPNVCRVYDIGEADGFPFISMEYVDGEDLASLLQRIGRLPSDKALEIARKLCAGLAAAHERGVIHRDLKPQNVMLDKRGQVVIMDFGLAAVTGKLTGKEARNGTPAYMSPEQLRGDSVTIRSDIYALGLIFYELFTGKRAFEANSVADLLRLQESSRPVSMTSLAVDVDPAVEKVILRCLSVNPAERPPDALAIAAALPGGDPLAAALAAGETPSPQLVAASGDTLGYRLHYSIPCLVFALSVILAYPFLLEPISRLAASPVEFPPAVLEQKSREIAAAFGYPEKPVDWTSWLAEDNDLVSYLKDKKIPNKNWRQLFEAAPSLLYRYRQSPDYLASAPDGDITTDRPPPTRAGMVSILLDSRANLREFRAIAPRYDTSQNTAPTPTMDPALVFQRAGLDLSTFHEIAPVFAPPLPFDARRAWTGNYRGLPDTPVVVEIASWHGVVTSFSIRWPWTKPTNDHTETASASQIFFEAFSVILLVIGIFCAVFYARHNLRSGRGDRKGAIRLAMGLALLFLGAWLPRVHPIPRMEMIGYSFSSAGIPALMAGMLWLVYMAIEPAVRAKWPHSLITWNRLLAGKFMDPLFGSHVLLGLVIGLAMRCVFLWRFHWTVAQGGPPDDTNLDVLMGTRMVIAVFFNTMFNAVVAGIVIFFVLTGLRKVVRRDWVAAIIAAGILIIQEGTIRTTTHPEIDIPLFIAIYMAFAMSLFRMGLVPTIVAIFTVNIMGSIPVSGQFFAWYNSIAVFEVCFLAAVAIFGFWRSQSMPALPGASMPKSVQKA